MGIMMEKDSNLVACDSSCVMIVDDEAIIRKLFTVILSTELQSVDIKSACNGREAVEVFNESHPAVILMDLRMPEMDGRQAFLAIMQSCVHRGWSQPSVVFCSGFPPPEAVTQLIGDGSKHCMYQKPVSGGKLIAAVRERL